MPHPDAPLSQLLNPKRFPGMSGKMAAIVGHVIGEHYTEPALEEIIVTSDNIVLGRQAGDIGTNEILGALDDLKRNWTDLLDAADLTSAQRHEAEAAFARRVVQA